MAAHNWLRPGRNASNSMQESCFGNAQPPPDYAARLAHTSSSEHNLRTFDFYMGLLSRRQDLNIYMFLPCCGCSGHVVLHTFWLRTSFRLREFHREHWGSVWAGLPSDLFSRLDPQDPAWGGPHANGKVQGGGEERSKGRCKP